MDHISAGLRAALTSLVVYLLMPLMGWWVGGTVLWPVPFADLLSSYMAEPVRWVYAIIAGLLAAVSGYLDMRVPPNPSTLAARPHTLHWRNIAIETVLVLSPFCDRRDLLTTGDFSTLRWAGVVIFLGGISLAMCSGEIRRLARLDQNSGPFDPILLVKGPFRQLRYPIYLGQIIFSVGASLIFRSWVGLGSSLIMLIFILLRIREEEQQARTQFGMQWTAYAQHSWKLIPFIY